VSRKITRTEDLIAMNAPPRKHAHPVPRPVTAPVRGEAPPASLLRTLGFTLLFAVLTGFLLLLAATAIALCSRDPDALITPLGVSAACLTALLSGAFAVRLHGSGVLLCGAAAGTLWTLLLLLTSLLLPESAAVEPFSLGTQIALRCCQLPIAVAGAYLGLSCQKASRRRTLLRRATFRRAAHRPPRSHR
jgi:hypothetical protein